MNHTLAFVMPITINFKHRSRSSGNHVKACFSNLKNIIFIKKVSLGFWSPLVISNIHKIVNFTIFIVCGSINAHITFLNEFVLQNCEFVFILSPGLFVRIIVCFKPLINSLNFFFYLVVKLVFLGRIICLFCYSNCLPIRIKFGLWNYRNWNRGFKFPTSENTINTLKFFIFWQFLIFNRFFCFNKLRFIGLTFLRADWRTFTNFSFVNKCRCGGYKKILIESLLISPPVAKYSRNGFV